jgi:hypothetical protein
MPVIICGFVKLLFILCQNIFIAWFRNNTGVTGTGNLSRFWHEIIKPGCGYPV